MFHIPARRLGFIFLFGARRHHRPQGPQATTPFCRRAAKKGAARGKSLSLGAQRPTGERERAGVGCPFRRNTYVSSALSVLRSRAGKWAHSKNALSPSTSTDLGRVLRKQCRLRQTQSSTCGAIAHATVVSHLQLRVLLLRAGPGISVPREALIKSEMRVRAGSVHLPNPRFGLVLGGRAGSPTLRSIAAGSVIPPFRMSSCPGYARP